MERVDVGSNTKFGRVLKLLGDGVVVENGRGERRTVNFKKLRKRRK